jgi:hypothetical protein
MRDLEKLKNPIKQLVRFFLLDSGWLMNPLSDLRLSHPVSLPLRQDPLALQLLQMDLGKARLPSRKP